MNLSIQTPLRRGGEETKSTQAKIYSSTRPLLEERATSGLGASDRASDTSGQHSQRRRRRQQERQRRRRHAGSGAQAAVASAIVSTVAAVAAVVGFLLPQARVRGTPVRESNRGERSEHTGLNRSEPWLQQAGNAKRSQRARWAQAPAHATRRDPNNSRVTTSGQTEAANKQTQQTEQSRESRMSAVREAKADKADDSKIVQGRQSR